MKSLNYFSIISVILGFFHVLITYKIESHYPDVVVIIRNTVFPGIHLVHYVFKGP